MSFAAEESITAPRSSRRTWWIMGSALALLLGLTVWLYVFHDVPAPDPALYELEFEPVLAASEDDQLRLEQHWREVELAYTEINRGSTSTASPADKERLQDQFAEALRSFATLALETRALPWREEGVLATTHETLLWIGVPITFAMTDKVANSKADETLLLARLMMRLGSQIQTSMPVLFHSAKAREASAMEFALKALPQLGLNSPQLSELINELPSAEEDIALLINHCKVDLISSINWCRTADLDELMVYVSLMFSPHHGEPQIKDAATYKRNATQVLLFEITQELVNEYQHGSHLALLMLEDLISGTGLTQNKLGYLHPNRSGLIIARGMLVSHRDHLFDSFELVAKRRTLRLALALRRFELEQGALPPKLDDLVPDYLDALPEDPIAGEPMKWNREQGCLYSVGSNGVDDGGIVNPAGWPLGLDWGIIYPWSAQANQAEEKSESK